MAGLAATEDGRTPQTIWAQSVITRANIARVFAWVLARTIYGAVTLMMLTLVSMQGRTFRFVAPI